MFFDSFLKNKHKRGIVQGIMPKQIDREPLLSVEPQAKHALDALRLNAAIRKIDRLSNGAGSTKDGRYDVRISGALDAKNIELHDLTDDSRDQRVDITLTRGKDGASLLTATEKVREEATGEMVVTRTFPGPLEEDNGVGSISLNEINNLAKLAQQVERIEA